MNKRYMDFVPAKAKKKVDSNPKAKSSTKTEVIVPKPKAKVVTKKPSERKVVAEKNDARLGIIEDLRSVEYKEPTVQKSHFNEKKDGIRAIKAKKVGSRGTVSGKPSGLTTKPKNDGVYKTPKSPFINQDKIIKRPLSKNVYQKKVEIPKEEPKGPVTIITKPEKQAHVSLIVTIILTIILGAAAGTVAFLLLPK